MTDRPLAGRSVVVTRSRSQASTLAGRLADLGAEVVELPVIAVEGPPDDGGALARSAHRLASGAYQWVALTSPNAAKRLVAELGDRAVPTSVRWAAVGPGTARALEDGGRPVDLVPDVSLAEALAEAFPDGDGTVLFPRAETVRGTLAEGLRAKGWVVDEVVAYRTVAGEPTPARWPRPVLPMPWCSPRPRRWRGPSSSSAPVDCRRWWSPSARSPRSRPGRPEWRWQRRPVPTPSRGWWVQWSVPWAAGPYRPRGTRLVPGGSTDDTNENRTKTGNNNSNSSSRSWAPSPRDRGGVLP